MVADQTQRASSTELQRLLAVREDLHSTASAKMARMERMKVPNFGEAYVLLKTLLRKAVRRRRLSFLDYLVVFLFVIGAGLLAYSFFYIHYYDVHGSAMSFFPWKWLVIYHSSSSINKEFYDGVGVSSFLIVVSLLISIRSYLQGRKYPIPQVVPSPEFVAARETKQENRRLRKQKMRENQTIFTYVESKLHRKSRRGAIALSIIAIVALIVSYKFPGPVIDFSSVIAFIGVLILIFVDTISPFECFTPAFLDAEGPA